MKIGIGCDFAAYRLKSSVIEALNQHDITLIDVGCYSPKEGVFIDAAKAVASKVSNKEFDCGILICGTGQGMVMAANRFPDVRAALVSDVFPAVLCKEHNNANVLCMGAWLVEPSKAIQIVEAWLNASFNTMYAKGLEELRELEQKA